MVAHNGSCSGTAGTALPWNNWWNCTSSLPFFSLTGLWSGGAVCAHSLNWARSWMWLPGVEGKVPLCFQFNIQLPLTYFMRPLKKLITSLALETTANRWKSRFISWHRTWNQPWSQEMQHLHKNVKKKCKGEGEGSVTWACCVKYRV